MEKKAILDIIIPEALATAGLGRQLADIHSDGAVDQEDSDAFIKINSWKSQEAIRRKMGTRKPPLPISRGLEKGRAPGAAEMAARIRDTLRSRANAAKARSGQAFFKEPVILFGISALEIQNLAKEIYTEVKRVWSWREAAALADLLLPDLHLETKGVAILIMGRLAGDAPAPVVLRKAQSWLLAGYCNNWATVDTLCPKVISPILVRSPGLLGRMKDWPLSRNRWIVRASAVSLIPLARRGIALDSAYHTARRLFDSPDDLIQKANGWLLREAGKTDGRRLERFLLRHGPAIPRTTLRYAVERFPASRRKFLLRATQG
jgi:3-methyladenine DNA glycosylase AlkD